SPPLPPSPPEGPPRGTNFSRRKATQPLPPSPAFTRIVASSMNTRRRERTPGSVYRGLVARRLAPGRGCLPWRYPGLLDHAAFGRFNEPDERFYVFAAVGLRFQLLQRLRGVQPGGEQEFIGMVNFLNPFLAEASAFESYRV